MSNSIIMTISDLKAKIKEVEEQYGDIPTGVYDDNFAKCVSIIGYEVKILNGKPCLIFYS